MTRLGCLCGASMGGSDCPSPYNFHICYEKEIASALESDPNISLMAFLLGCWQPKKTQDVRDFEFWHCLECHRMYEVQAIPEGRWTRVYHPIEQIPASVPNITNFQRIYVMPETDTDAVTEIDENITLKKYLGMRDAVRWWLSPDEQIAWAIKDGQVINGYYLEQQWEPASSKKG